MQVSTIDLDPRIAKIYYSDYLVKCREHRKVRQEGLEEARLKSSQAYRAARKELAELGKEDFALLAAYRELKKGNKILLHLPTVLSEAGLNDKRLPKLAVAPAHATICRLNWAWGAHSRQRAYFTSDVHVPEKERLWYPPGDDNVRLIDSTWRKNHGYPELHSVSAVVPTVPAVLRPADLETGIGYHILWEAVWEVKPPVDPILMKRIQKTDFYVVLAKWDLTALERAALFGSRAR